MAYDNGQLSEAELGDLAAFADGSLAQPARVAVAARVEGSPKLRGLVEEQRRAIAAIETLDVRAPAPLRARLRTVRTAARRRARFRNRAFAGGVAVAVVAAFVVVAVLADGPAAPSFDEAVDVAQRGPTGPAPPTADGDPDLLAASISGVAFPDYSRTFDWRPVGERADELHGRRTATVYYRHGGREVAYTIVSGEPLAWPEGARTTRRDGIELRSLAADGASVVTWLRNGHTCLLAGEDVRPEALRELAAWMGEGSAVR